MITCMEDIRLDETKQRIIDATMALIRDKGYVTTTTKDIANMANVNECTIFRKFKSKQEIVVAGIQQEQWRGNVTPDIFTDVVWELEPDLEMFMNNYMQRITPDFVKLSIGLRAPQIYEEAAPFIRKIPEAFLGTLTSYFEQMHEKGKIKKADFESLAMTIFSTAFGFTLLKASFQDTLTTIERQDFVKKSVMLFAQGILKL